MLVNFFERHRPNNVDEYDVPPYKFSIDNVCSAVKVGYRDDDTQAMGVNLIPVTYIILGASLLLRRGIISTGSEMLM